MSSNDSRRASRISDRPKASARTNTLPQRPMAALSRSAIRIPSTNRAFVVFGSASPRILVHEGRRQGLERKLSDLVGRPVLLQVTDNRRTMIAIQRYSGVMVLRLHHMFLDADEFTLRALVRYVDRGERQASSIVGRYIEARRQLIKPRPERPRVMRTVGAVHDLGKIFIELNRKYFHGLVDARVTWGVRVRVKRKRTAIKLGTYCAEQKLIRMHPVLDRAWVPRYFVEFVLYHEMLHHMVPMPDDRGRRSVHSPEFLEREKAFASYERATRWEEANIDRLLRA